MGGNQLKPLSSSTTERPHSHRPRPNPPIYSSHLSEYLIDFTSWKPGKPPAAAFAVPNGCPDATAAAAAAAAAPAPTAASATAAKAAANAAKISADARAARIMQAAALMPWSRLGSAAQKSESEGASAQLLLRRAAARAESVAFVEAHDAEAAGYELAVNRFRWAWGLS